jgi:RNA polymerase sigma factor (sigma-70 family)
VPDHAFSIVYDNTKHADVETTTAQGFNPTRDAVKEFEERTRFVYIPDSHRDRRREIGEVGLAAIIYYNHAVLLAHERRWHESLGQFFRALSLDPGQHSALKNTLMVLALWSRDLAHTGKYEQAEQVLDAGLELAPRDARLRHNRKAVWTQWALALVEQGKDSEALAVLRRAAAAVPDGHFTAMQAWVFIHKAESRARAGKWQEALAVLDPGKAQIDKPAAEELRHYRTGLRVRWAHAEMAERRFPKAVDILAEGMAADSADQRLPAHLAFAVQEHAVFTHSQDEARAREVLAGYVKRFAKVRAVQDVAAGYVWAVVKKLLKAGQFEKALAFINNCRDLLPDDRMVRRLALAVYDAWADDSYRVRTRAAESLGEQTGSKESVDALIKALSDKDGYVRRAAADGLKKQGDKSAVPALMKRVADDVWVPIPKRSFTYYDEPYDNFKGLGSKDHALEALKALASSEQVNTALQEAAKLQKEKFDFATPDNLVALAVTMVRRKAACQWRHLQRQKRLDGTGGEAGDLVGLLASLSCPRPDPEQTAQFNDQLRRLCDHLDDSERRVLQMRLQGHTTAEIAQELGLSHIALRVRLTRLRQYLRDAGALDDWL